ncbi:hypothetical protein QQM79_07290 [Marinobacteraceae bacterium S3BR75-40.1]
MVMRLIVPMAFVLFAAFTAWVLATYPEGFWSWFFGLIGNSATLQVVLDLSISLLLLWQFIYWDHKARGGNAGVVVVFLVLTLGLGVIAPLAFLTLRALKPRWFYPEGVSVDGAV